MGVRLAFLIMLAVLSLQSRVIANDVSLGLDSSASRIIEAPANTVLMIHPDINTANPKPPGVGYPDSTSSALYQLAMGIILGMQANTEQETIDTNPQFFDTATGAPILSNSNFVFMSPPTVEAQMAYYESRRVAPVYLSGNETSLYWVSVNGQVVIQETVTPRSALTSPTDVFLLEAFTDSGSNYIFAGYGLTARGSIAAAVFYKKIYQELSGYNRPWYMYRWTDTNRNGIVDSSDEYAPVVSENEYPVPELGHSQLSIALIATILLASLWFLKRVPRLQRPPLVRLHNPMLRKYDPTVVATRERSLE